jgi:hypothetical protein
MLHPAWMRAASGDTLGGRSQYWLKQAIAMSEEAADLMVTLLTPASVVAWALGLWRLAADLDWTETFPISSGFFSHWQVWVATAIVLNAGASFLVAKTRRNGKTSEEN